MADATAESSSWASSIYRAIFGNDVGANIPEEEPKPAPTTNIQPKPRASRYGKSEFEDLAQYKYRPLPGDQYIRLVTIKPGQMSDPMVCTISEASLDSADYKFYALSYTWGAPEKSKSISCNGCRLNVTENLFLALEYLRHPEDDICVWIDQICINQEDLSERAQQVQLMRTIYGIATLVVVWLGREWTSSGDAFALARRIFNAPQVGESEQLDPADYQKAGLPKATDTLWWALRDAFRLPWFSRVWTLQEIVLPGVAVVMWGKQQIGWDYLMTVADRVPNVLPSRWVGTNPSSGGLPMNRINGIKWLQQGYRARDEYEALQLLIQYRNCAAGDLRDKIYGMLALADYGIVPDYSKDVKDLYVEYAAKYIQSVRTRRQAYKVDTDREGGEILTLVLSGGRLNQKLELPSWVPDWSVDFRSNPTWPIHLEGFLDCYPMNGRVTVLPGNRLQIPAKVWTTIREAGSRELELDTHWNPPHRDTYIEGWFAEANRIAALVKDKPYPEQLEEGLNAKRQQARAFEKTLTHHEQGRIRLGRSAELTGYGLTEKDLTQFLQRWSYRGAECHRLRDKSLYARAVINAQYQVFYLTTTGHFGMAPRGVRAGDTIAYVHRDILVVLRQEGDEYILLGVCTATATESIATEGIPISWITLK